MTGALAPLAGASVGLLTSFRRDGRGVGTPVGITVTDARVHFTTRSKTWKVKRIARNPAVTVAPCTKSGRALGPAVPGTARRLSPAEAATVTGGVQYRIWTLVYRIFYRDVPITYEFTPDALEAP